MANTFKTLLLLIALSAVLVLVGGALGGQQGLVIALAISLGINFFSYWFSDKMVLMRYGAQEISEADAPRLHAVVAGLCQTAQIPKPKIYRIPVEGPNAFATGRNPSHAAVAVTDGLLDLLSEEELKGVLAHELAHVKHRDILIMTVAASIASAIMFLAQMARFAAFFGGGRDDREGGINPIAFLVSLIVAPLAAMLIQMAISRSREYEADAGGARMAGNAEGLASALRKLGHMSARVPVQASPATAHLFIVKPFTGGGIMELFATHPPMEKRIAKLQELRGQL